MCFFRVFFWFLIIVSFYIMCFFLNLFFVFISCLLPCFFVSFRSVFISSFFPLYFSVSSLFFLTWHKIDESLILYSRLIRFHVVPHLFKSEHYIFLMLWKTFNTLIFWAGINYYEMGEKNVEININEKCVHLFHYLIWKKKLIYNLKNFSHS